MKARKRLGNVLTCLGGITLFIGLIAYLLPRSENRQLQLITESFRTPTEHWLLKGMNNGMSAAMDHYPVVLVIGLVLVLLGILLICSLRTAPRQAQQPRQTVYVPAAAAGAAQPNPFARNQPAAANEANPFARYIAPDAIPKSTAVRGAAPAPREELPLDVPPAAETELIDTDETELIDTDENGVILPFPVQAQEPDEDGYFPLQTEDEEADEDVFFGLVEDDDEPFDDEAAVSAEDALDAEEDDDSAAPACEELVEAVEESFVGDDAPEADEADDEPIIPDDTMPDDPEDSSRQEEPAQQANPLYAAAASPGLRPAIRSTFKKSTLRQTQQPQESAAPANAEAGQQPALRIKSTIGHKR